MTSPDPRLVELAEAALAAEAFLPDGVGSALAGVLRHVGRDIDRHGYCTAPVGMGIAIGHLTRELVKLGTTET